MVGKLTACSVDDLEGHKTCENLALKATTIGNLQPTIIDNLKPDTYK